MEKRSAEKTLQGILRDGEQVLWSGKTEAFPLLAGDAKELMDNESIKKAYLGE